MPTSVTLHLRTPRAKHSKRAKVRTPPTMTAANMDIRPFTESQSSRILLTHSTRWPYDHILESQDKPASRRHRPNTPAGELGLGLQDNVLCHATYSLLLCHTVYNVYIYNNISQYIITMYIYNTLMPLSNTTANTGHNYDPG